MERLRGNVPNPDNSGAMIILINNNDKLLHICVNGKPLASGKLCTYYIVTYMEIVNELSSSPMFLIAMNHIA